MAPSDAVETRTDEPSESPKPSTGGYVQLVVDVPALTTSLDGRYGVVRNLVRANLAEHRQILLDDETRGTTEFRDREDMDQFGMVRFVAGPSVETVLDKRGIDGGMDPGEVFSRVQDHVIAAARAHVELMVLDSFVEKIRVLPDGELKVALNLLCDLHALCTIEADRAWFVEHGWLFSARSKAISREINARCRKIRPLAVDLVDAWGVPDEVLRSEEILIEPVSS